MNIDLIFRTSVFIATTIILILPFTVIAQEGHELQFSTQGPYFNVGIFSTVVPGTDVYGNFGFQAGFTYELPDYAVEAEFRMFDNQHVHFGTISVGSKFYLNRKNISSYVGGGVATSVSSYGEEDNNGVGIYAVMGISFLRSIPYRLKYEIRIHRPFYTLETQDVMPIMVGLFLSRKWSGFRWN